MQVGREWVVGGMWCHKEEAGQAGSPGLPPGFPPHHGLHFGLGNWKLLSTLKYKTTCSQTFMNLREGVRHGPSQRIMKAEGCAFQYPPTSLWEQ